MMKKHKKQAIVSIVLVSCLALTGFSVQVKSLEQIATTQLLELGYTQDEARAFLTYSNLPVIAKEQELILQEQYQQLLETLEVEIGLPAVNMPVDENSALISKIEQAANYIEQKRSHYTTSIDQSVALLTQFDVNLEMDASLSLVQKDAMATEAVNTVVEDLKSQVSALGASQNQVDELLSDNILDSANNLNNEIIRLKAERANLGYYFDRDGAMAMFYQVNAYRASQGLAPYTYNYGQQSCVDAEAAAYASNNNPHNWACKTVANENAGISSVKSDYVKIAMNFFIADPPHHAVLVGNHQSAAVSIVIKNGTAYMILDVFNFR